MKTIVFMPIFKNVALGGVLAKVLDYTWFIVKDCQMIKKWDNHFPGENSHLKAEQTTLQFQTTA